jgi:hypothetical protein
MIFSGGNLSLQYVNPMNCIIIFGIGCVGGGPSCGWFRTSRMSGLSLALHWHFLVIHVHGRSHGGTMLSYCLLLFLPAFMSV